MFFKRYFLLTVFCCAQANAENYLQLMAQAIRQHPAYPNYRAMVSSAQSLSSIEKARRWPKVDGILSRIDGKQSLVETQSAWQTGFSISYPIYESGKQDARERAAQGEVSQEMAVGLGWMETTAYELGNHYIKLWEATLSIQEITSAVFKLEAFGQALNDKINAGEVSPLTLAKVARRRIELSNKLIDAKGKETTALAAWEYAGQSLPERWYLPDESKQADVLNNANLMKLEAEVAKAKADIDIARSEEGLSVQLGASYLERKYEYVSEWRNAQSWQITGSYPLFDGGLSSSQTQRKLLVHNQKLSELAAQKSQAGLEIKRIKQDQAQLEKLKVELTNLCQLQEALAHQMTNRFTLGRGEAIEVVEAQVSLMDCKVQLLKQNSDIYQRRNDHLKWSGVLAQSIRDQEP